MPKSSLERCVRMFVVLYTPFFWGYFIYLFYLFIFIFCSLWQFVGCDFMDSDIGNLTNVCKFLYPSCQFCLVGDVGNDRRI